MNVLVVEDDDDKLEALVAFLKQTFSVSEVDKAKSLQSGLLGALKPEYDLILLDMTMRNFDRTVIEDGGRPHAFAGREILRQMKRAGIDTPTIVVTHFAHFGEADDLTTLEDLKSELKSKFSNYVGTVQYRGNVDEWKEALASMVSNTMGWGKRE